MDIDIRYCMLDISHCEIYMTLHATFGTLLIRTRRQDCIIAIRHRRKQDYSNWIVEICRIGLLIAIGR